MVVDDRRWADLYRGVVLGFGSRTNSWSRTSDRSLPFPTDTVP